MALAQGRRAQIEWFIEDAYGDVPPPPPFVEGATIGEVLWRLSPLREADGIGENLTDLKGLGGFWTF